MDKVRDHVEAFPVEAFLAGMVEMKLFEGISLVANYKIATRRVIDHDCMTVVDDAERDGFVREF